MSKGSNNGQSGLDRVLVLEVARVTEAAAIAAARWRGQGKNKDADHAAVDAMRKELGRVNIRGTVVIGEGEMDEAPMLYIGEEVGIGDGPRVDIAVDPLEGTTICAKDMPNALAVIAISEENGLLNAPAQIEAAREMARAKGGLVDDISRLRAGNFYVAAEGEAFHRIVAPWCLSYHPSSPPSAEDVLELAISV